MLTRAMGEPAKGTKPTSGQALHFFPGPHVIVWVVGGKPQIRAEAWGGELPKPGVSYAVMKPRPTTPGRYVIYSYEPYRTNTWPLSKLAWGTRLKIDGEGDIIYETGLGKRPWKKLRELLAPTASTRDFNAALADMYQRLYGPSSRLHDFDGDGIPDRWVFNDFGPTSVRYFVDKNRNKKLDAGEALSGEMIHTTPDNEAQAAKGESVALVPSHGCIHVNPVDRDKLYTAGAFAKGNDLIIHEYKEDVPADLMK